MRQFTLAAGAIYAIVLVPLTNGNPDPNATIGSVTDTGDPAVRQLTSPTVLNDGSTAPVGTWVVDLTQATPGANVEIDVAANITFSDGAQNESGKSIVTVGPAAVPSHSLDVEFSGPGVSTGTPG